LTKITRIPSNTRTCKRIDTIGTSSTIQARRRVAFVDVGLTTHTGETSRALASETINAIQARLCLSTQRNAWIGRAFIDVGLTEQTGKTRRTRTGEAIGRVITSTTVGTRRGSTLVDVSFAAHAGETGITHTNERVDVIQTRLRLNAYTGARITRTFVDVCLTERTVVAGSARAFEPVNFVVT
jgi:hypothetical protein